MRNLLQREAKFGLKLRHWLKANKRSTCALELKQSTTDSIPFSCLEESQIDWLQAIHSDEGALVRVPGGSGEPDYLWLRNEPAHVVIRFPRMFHLIDIDTFVLEKKRSKRKSLTNARAREISVVSVPV